MAKAMPIRTATIALDGDYAGFTITVRLNASYAVKQDLNSGDEPRILSALKVLVHDWNLTDEAGNALPLPRDGCDVLTAIPDEVLAKIISGYVEKINEAASVPKA